MFTSSRGFSQHDINDGAFDGEMWTCFICQRRWPRKRQLEQHLQSGTHDRGNYDCKTCGQTFSRGWQLLQHHSRRCQGPAARLGRLMAHDASEAGTFLLTNGSRGVAEATLRFDGGARPNPGTGGAGYVIYDLHNYFVARGAVAVDIYPATNNQAEYIGLIEGLERALEERILRLHVQGDSQLVIRQMLGQYEIRSRLLYPLYCEASDLKRKFHSVTFSHIPRDQNSEADELAEDAVCGHYYR